MTTKIKYEGNLRTTMVHLQSKTEILTDAPTDNQGKGEAFSPTDLLASALGSCIVTTMAIYAKAHGFDLGNCSCDVTKIMTPAPRRVGEVVIDLFLEDGFTEKQRAGLEHAAHACPVARSLHPDLIQNVNFNYQLIAMSYEL